MIAFAMIVRDVLGQGLPEMPLAERNDAIETFLFDGPDEALGVRVRIGRLKRRLHDMYAELSDAESPSARHDDSRTVWRTSTFAR